MKHAKINPGQSNLKSVKRVSARRLTITHRFNETHNFNEFKIPFRSSATFVSNLKSSRCKASGNDFTSSTVNSFRMLVNRSDFSLVQLLSINDMKLMFPNCMSARVTLRRLLHRENSSSQSPFRWYTLFFSVQSAISTSSKYGQQSVICCSPAGISRFSSAPSSNTGLSENFCNLRK